MRRQNIYSKHKRRSGTRRPKPILAFAVIVIVSACLITYTAVRPRSASFILETDSRETTAVSTDFQSYSPTVTFTKRYVPVHLDGAVARPGVYYIEEDSILDEVIQEAGGLIPEADVTYINLAMKIDANIKIYVPRSDESFVDIIQRNESTSAKKNMYIDINRASMEELETLPGVGPSTAEAIILFREENGPFKSIEELMLVPGIKEGRFKRMKDRLRVE
ncbi:MAG: hypothetical protein GX939_05690 [Clostridiaceae bacterium]|jgi:competence protein ComEA|nr:hypothetical protein [Clostridiaceae bacterium]